MSYGGDGLFFLLFSFLLLTYQLQFFHVMPVVFCSIVQCPDQTPFSIHEVMEYVLGVNFFEKFQDIISNYKNGIMQKTFNQLGPLDYRRIFLASDLVRDMRVKLDNDAPQLSLSDALSYLLIIILREGYKKESRKPEINIE